MNVKALLSIPLLVLAAQVHADCQAPRAVALPSTDSAGTASMLASQTEVQSSISALLECRQERSLQSEYEKQARPSIEESSGEAGVQAASRNAIASR